MYIANKDDVRVYKKLARRLKVSAAGGYSPEVPIFHPPTLVARSHVLCGAIVPMS
jgi:hypothetical protein